MPNPIRTNNNNDTRGGGLFSAKAPHEAKGSDNGMYMGYIKDASDVQTMGRLKVWIPEFNTKEDDEKGWRIVSYCSPFAGATNLRENGKEDFNSDQTQTSYGMWMVPPDIDNQVIVCFLNGDPTKGYWMGCIYQQNMNSSVPDSKSDENYIKNEDVLPAEYEGVPVPTSEYNKNTLGNVGLDQSRPVNKIKTKAISEQGLIRDSVRGQSTSSAKRNPISEVYGITTPGPINPDSPNKKGRIGGSSLIMDDGEGSEYVALKTRSGAQIRIDETNGMIYLINKKGTGWIQIDEDGYGDIFCAKDLSMRALRDFNVRADRDVNIEGGRNINIKSTKDYIGEEGMGIGSEDSGSGGKITIEALDTISIGASKNLIFDSESNSITCGELNLKTEGDFNAEAGGNFGLGAGANISMESAAQSSIIGGASVDIDGGLVNLNSGSSAPPNAASTLTFENIESSTKNDNLKDFENSEFKFDRKTQEFTSISGRVPTFEPYGGHSLK